MWPIRSALFVPAHRRDWVAKAIRVSPGAVVLDIEDSVPPQFKPQAMGYLKSEIGELRDAGVGAFVRIQPLHDGTAAEIEAAVTDGLTAIVPPKVASPDEIRRLHDLLSYAEGRAGVAHGTVGILPLPETAQGMYDAYHLAKASNRVRGIHGALSGPVSGDFARAFGFRATTGGDEQLYLASKLVLDSRAGGAMYPIAGIFGTAQDDLPAVERLIRRARADRLYRGCGDASFACRHRQCGVSADRGRSRLLQGFAGGVRGGGESRSRRGQLPGGDGGLRDVAAGEGGSRRGGSEPVKHDTKPRKDRRAAVLA